MQVWANYRLMYFASTNGGDRLQRRLHTDIDYAGRKWINHLQRIYINLWLAVLASCLAQRAWDGAPHRRLETLLLGLCRVLPQFSGRQKTWIILESSQAQLRESSVRHLCDEGRAWRRQCPIIKVLDGRQFPSATT